jgi:hypothetical protein
LIEVVENYVDDDDDDDDDNDRVLLYFTAAANVPRDGMTKPRCFTLLKLKTITQNARLGRENLISAF